MSDRLFSPRFFIMFGFSFTVFMSVFQLLPTAPYRVLELGGSTAVAGLFHGFLTFASAASAAFAGPITDRIGHRRVLIGVSLLLAAFTASYAVISSYQLMLAVVIAHGLIWSALLSASGAYMTAAIPATRRGEGLGYWGLASVMAMGAAPAIGFWVYNHGWAVLCGELALLNLLMAAIAWWLPEDEPHADAWTDIGATSGVSASDRMAQFAGRATTLVTTHVEWRVVGLSIATTMVSFGYGGLTSFSAMFADSLGLAPRSLFLTVMAIGTAVGRLTVGRRLDTAGPRRMFIRCLAAPPIGLFLLAASTNRPMLMAAGLVFGAGFGLLWPAYNTYVQSHVGPARRGAVFGATLAAFDTGIGAGASAMGWCIHHYGFRVAFVAAAVISALALPYFVFAERWFGFADRAPTGVAGVSL
jgi:MFS family permease